MSSVAVADPVTYAAELKLLWRQEPSFRSWDEIELGFVRDDRLGDKVNASCKKRIPAFGRDLHGLLRCVG